MDEPLARIVYSHGVLVPRGDAQESLAALFEFCSVCSSDSPGFTGLPPLRGDAWPHPAVFSFYRQEMLSECFI